jgi:hypothetical protein
LISVCWTIIIGHDIGLQVMREKRRKNKQSNLTEVTKKKSKQSNLVEGTVKGELIFLLTYGLECEWCNCMDDGCYCEGFCWVCITAAVAEAIYKIRTRDSQDRLLWYHIRCCENTALLFLVYIYNNRGLYIYRA